MGATTGWLARQTTLLYFCQANHPGIGRPPTANATPMGLERGSVVSEEKSNEAPERNSTHETPEGERKTNQNGPVFTESPDPLSGVRKAAGDAWKSTEGKTVSMRVYIGSIAAVIILMMLARCGGQ